MFHIRSVHFDDFIPGWRSYEMRLPYHVLAFVTQGQVLYKLNGRHYRLEQGDILFIPKGTLRAAENDENGPHRKFTVLFEDETADRVYIPILDRQVAHHLRLRNSDYLAGRFMLLYYGHKGEWPIDRMLFLNLLQEVLLLVSKEAELQTISPAKLTQAQKIRNYLLENYRKSIQIDELAELIGRSPNYTSALFKEATGQTPIQFVLHLRIAEARRLLLHSDMTVAEISHYLGFYDPAYFYRTFKRAASVTPSEFRARHGNER
ncbi:helix-turn-helix transcriptional regulator [Cohnella massiliensis]|uniref:helix-turn-helix transcriptional regulator n=1 Tax=Cohnella massiliensis TaxID=1816691 RepID=UPI0009BB2248|nr:helix-turn-helix domain-containing protein [Cohnella massiliensis]